MLPWIESDKFVLHILSLIAIASIVAMGLQVLLGYSGQLSIGQAAFYGIGAYTSALLTAKLGVPFPLALIGRRRRCRGVASLLMVPITRLTGAYLAVATLGFSIIVYLFIKNEEWLTGGSYGFIGIPRAELLGYVLRDPMYSYYLNVGVAAVVYLTFARIEGSRFGRAINAIRQDADAARASGIRVTLLKSQCFVIAAFVAGLAGSLYAHEVRYLAPERLHVLEVDRDPHHGGDRRRGQPAGRDPRRRGGGGLARISARNRRLSDAGVRRDPDGDDAVRRRRAGCDVRDVGATAGADCCRAWRRSFRRATRERREHFALPKAARCCWKREA